MGKPAPPKTKAAPSGPPPLFDEANSGPPAIVDTAAPTAWVNTSATSPTEGSTEPQRWGHAVALSASESTLCVVGGRPCSTQVGPDVPLALLAWTSAQHSRSAKAVHGWQSQACVLTPSVPSTQPAKDVWPQYAPWAITWSGGAGEAERPRCAAADGGWADGRRLSGKRVYAAAGAGGAAAAEAALAPATAAVAAAASRSHHSVTAVSGAAYRFGGETQAGTVAALEALEKESRRPSRLADAEAAGRGGAVPTEAAALTTAAAVADLPPSSRPATGASPLSSELQPPPRAAHGACCLCDRYLFVFGGRCVLWDGKSSSTAEPAAGGGAAASGKGAAGGLGKAAAPGKAAAAREPAGAKRSDGAGGGGVAPVLTALSDVALYDTRLQAWLPVRVSGGEGPCGRFAAAVAAVPTSSSPSASGGPPVVNHREVLVLGGLDAAGRVCDDAWVLQFLSGADGELMDSGKDGAAPVVSVRWIRVNVPSSAAALPAAPVPDSTTPAPAAAEAGRPEGPTVTVAAPCARHHAAAVVSSRRVVFVVGGCVQDSNAEPTAVAAVPAVFTFALPHLTAATVRVDGPESAEQLASGTKPAGGASQPAAKK